MKLIAGEFSTAMKQDEPLLESIVSKQSSYLDQIGKSHKKIDSISIKTSWWSSIKTAFILILSLIIFISMMSLIYFFPSKNYVYLKPS
jgi:hypothetical protein